VTAGASIYVRRKKEHARTYRKKKAANMHASGHVWCVVSYHASREKKTSSKHACKWVCVVLDHAWREREKEEHKSAEHVRESERNIRAHACMHIWSNQKEYSRTECTSAIGLNKQTYVSRRWITNLQRG